MIGNKCYNYPQASNHNRKQIEESTSRFLLLIDKQLTNTWYVSQSISPPLRGIIVCGISEENVRNANMFSVIRINLLYLQTSNHSRGRRRNIGFECK